MTTAILPTQHTDLISSLAFSSHGTRLATSSLDHTVRVASLSPQTGLFDAHQSEFKAHDAPVLRVVWASPEFGPILASGGTDGVVKVWAEEDAPRFGPTAGNGTGARGGGAGGAGGKKWTQKVALTDARGTIRDLEFSPAEFGLKLAAISSDSHLRVWECLDPVALADWSLICDIDLALLSSAPSSSSAQPLNSGTVPAGITPIKGFDAASPSKAGQMGTSYSSSGSVGSVENRRNGTVESEGGWALAWCKEAWWGERIAVCAGGSGIIRLFHLPDHAPWTNFLNLLPSRPSPSFSSTPPTSSLSWAPSSGRSYQLLASGARDGRARVWKVFPSQLDGDGQEEWTGEMDAELEVDSAALVVLALLGPQAASAHGYIREWTVGGLTALAQKQPLNQTAFRSVSNNTGFVGSDYITTRSVTCGSSDTPFNSTLPPGGLIFSDSDQSASKTMGANGGDSIQLVIAGTPGVGWPHDNGHIQTYLGLCGAVVSDCQNFDASTPLWFKIQSELEGVKTTLVPAYNATLDGNPYNITLPSEIVTGSYMLRFELIVFDQTSNTEGFQTEIYPFCGQIFIRGAASTNNFATIKFPEAYKDVFLSPSTVPGPGVLALPNSTSTSSSSSGTATSGHKSSKVSAGLIAGPVVGGVVVLLGIVIASWCFLRRRRTRPAIVGGGETTPMSFHRPLSGTTAFSTPPISPSSSDVDAGWQPMEVEPLKPARVHPPVLHLMEDV
ncbi:hypothetical protein RQP46_006774 [Phenoliferia psychrophenolica]